MPLPDLNTPVQDRGREVLRQSLVAAIQDIASNGGGVDDAYYLTDLLFSLLDGALTSLSQTRADLAALTDRVTALEPPPPPTP